MLRITIDRRQVAQDRAVGRVQVLVDRRDVVLGRHRIGDARRTGQHDDELLSGQPVLGVPVAHDPRDQRIHAHSAREQLFERGQRLSARRVVGDQCSPSRLCLRCRLGIVDLGAETGDPRRGGGKVGVPGPGGGLDHLAVARDRRLGVIRPIENRRNEPRGAAAQTVGQAGVGDRPVRGVTRVIEPTQALELVGALESHDSSRRTIQVQITLQRVQRRPRLIERQRRARGQQRVSLAGLDGEAISGVGQRSQLLLRVQRAVQLEQQPNLVELRRDTLVLAPLIGGQSAVAGRQRALPEAVPLQRIGLGHEQRRRAAAPAGARRRRCRRGWLRRRRCRLNLLLGRRRRRLGRHRARLRRRRRGPTARSGTRRRGRATRPKREADGSWMKAPPSRIDHGPPTR